MQEQENNPGTTAADKPRFDRIDLIPLAAAVLLAFCFKVHAAQDLPAPAPAAAPVASAPVAAPASK